MILDTLHKDSRLGSGGIIVHNDFLYILGLQRCGTNSTQEVLAKNFKNLSQYKCRYHMPIRFCSEQELQVPTIIGNIRNPFSFYLSYYQYHLKSKSNHEEWFNGHDKNQKFKRVLYTLLFELDWSQFADLLDANKYHKEQIWVRNNELNVGLFTLRYINPFFKDALEILNYYDNSTFMNRHDELITVNSICKLENLKTDMSKYINISFNEDIKTRNSTEEYWLKSPEDVMTNYDEEMIDWVRTKDSIFFKKYYKD